MGIFKAIRTLFSGKGSTTETPSNVTADLLDPPAGTEVPNVVHEPFAGFSSPSLETFPVPAAPVTSGVEVVSSSEVVEEKPTKPRRHRTSRTRTSRSHSK